jgi:redox-sensitive bicupin YhaK (pirin superfamily)
MTAASGIIHEEFHSEAFTRQGGTMEMVQLWVNLPAKDKMTAPAYQEFAAERIPSAQPAPGVEVKVIAGRIGEVEGPVRQPATDPSYFDIALDAGAEFEHALPAGHNVFAYVYEGEVGSGDALAGKGELLVFGAGDAVRFAGRAAKSRLILVAGRPINEPVARYGPFVMNTQAEIMQAMQDYQAGRF